MLSSVKEWEKQQAKIFDKSLRMGIIITILLCLLSWTVTSCPTTRGNVTSGSIIDDHKLVAELQTRNQQLENLYRQFRTDIGNIRNSADSAGSNIDLAIILFNEYNRRVEQLIRDYDNLQRSIGQIGRAHV